MEEVQQGQAIGLGITVDPDNDVVVIVVIQCDGETYAVSLTPEVAIFFGRSIRNLAREAQQLQDELDDLDPEEIVDRLTAIQNRYGATTRPEPPV
jgi:hypothetical protein